MADILDLETGLHILKKESSHQADSIQHPPCIALHCTTACAALHSTDSLFTGSKSIWRKSQTWMKERSPLTVLYYKMHACLLTVLETGLTAVSRYLCEMFVHKNPGSPSERASQTAKQGNSTNFCPIQAPCSLLQPTTGHSIRAGCHCISPIGIFIN